MIDRLETIPERSLVLLEEPELTLHPNAQRGLAWYLMSVSYRRGHQVLIATHSSELFEALPSAARTLLFRTATGVEVVNRASSFRAAHLLGSGGSAKGNLVIVEDDVAAGFLGELIRRTDASLLKSIKVVPLGSKHDVGRVVKALRDQGVNAVGVRDPDVGESPADCLYKLPGAQPLETQFVSEKNIKAAGDFISNIADVAALARVQVSGAKGTGMSKTMVEALAAHLEIEVAEVRGVLTRALLQPDVVAAGSALVGQISSGLGLAG